MEPPTLEIPQLSPAYTGITITIAVVNGLICVILAMLIFARRRLFPIRGLAPLLFTLVGFATSYWVGNLASELLQPEKCTQALWFAFSNFALLFFPYAIRAWKLFLQLHIASAQIQYLENEDTLGRFYTWLLKHKRIASEPYLFLQWLILTIIFVWIPISLLHLAQLDLYATEPRFPCQREPEFVALALFALSFVVVVSIVIHLIRRMPLRRDNFGIWQEVSRTGFILIFFVLLWFVFELLRRNVTSVRIEDYFPRQWFLMFMFVSAYIHGAGIALYRSAPEAPFFFGYLSLFSTSGGVSGHSSRTLDDGEEIDIDFDRLKNNFQSLLDGEEGAALKKEFARFLAREFSQENILFWDQIEQLHEIAEEDGEEVEKKCRQIYKQYVARNSPLEVNLPNHVALAVHNIVNVEQPVFTKTMYDEAQTVVFDLMKFDTFPRFLRLLDD